MPSVIVIGGGLAGLSAAAALGERRLSRRGVRSAPVPGRPRDFFSALAIRRRFRTDRQLPARAAALLRQSAGFLRAAGRARPHSLLSRVLLHRAGRADFHAAPRRAARAAAFHRIVPAHALSSSSPTRLAIARGLLALRRERTRRDDLDRITMLDWLREKRQTPRAIERFWRQVLVSAINEDLDRMAARHGFQVFWLGFLARADGYEMGVPAIPLGELYRAELWQRHRRCLAAAARAGGAHRCRAASPPAVRGTRADYYICALPFERLPAAGLARAGLRALADHRHPPLVRSPGDRPAARHAARPHHSVDVQQIGRPLPATGGERVARIVGQEPRGYRGAGASRAGRVLSARARSPAGEGARDQRTARHIFGRAGHRSAAARRRNDRRPDLFLAGDWTRSGWPATMEGAVRSGYLAAEAVARASGQPARFLLPDIA